jgi:hypothetical protein
VLGPIAKNCQEPRQRAKNCPHGGFNTYPASPLYKQFSVSSLGSTTAFVCLPLSNLIRPRNNPHAMPKSANVIPLVRQSSRSLKRLVFPNNVFTKSSLTHSHNPESCGDDGSDITYRPTRNLVVVTNPFRT